MAIIIRPEIEALIRQDVARGTYLSVEDFVEQAVQRLHEEEALRANERGAIHEKIERAFAQFDRGEYLSEEQSRAELQEHKAAWLAEQQES